MKAIVLCAGHGTRLGNLTDEIPKPMLPLNGRPILEYIVRHLAKHGFDQIAINLHFMPKTIQDYFGDGRKFRVTIHYSYEPVLLGTAGAVKKIADFWEPDESFLVHYGDVITNQDYMGMLRFHQAHPTALATLLLHQRAQSNSKIVMDSDQRIIKFLERPSQKTALQVTNSGWVNSGVYLVRQRILEYIPPDLPVDFPRDIFVPLVEKETILGYPLSAYRCAIDSPERYEQVQRDIMDGKYMLE